MNKKFNENAVKGIRISYFKYFLISFVAILCLFAISVSMELGKLYVTFIDNLNSYSKCNKSINDFKDATDFLTDQVRLFSVNMDPVFMENYFNEIDVLQRREKSLDTIKNVTGMDVPYNNMRIALQESKLLTNKELYGMRLICEAIHIDEKNIPNALKSVYLNDIDINLSDDQKLVSVRELLFDSEYLFSKERIAKYTDEAVRSFSSYYMDVQKTGQTEIQKCFLMIFYLLVLLFISFIAYTVIISRLVMVPVKEYIKNIESGSRMTSQGSYEMRYIANAYNKLCERNAVTASILKHKAEHDSLTGLINREGFDQIKNALADSKETIAYLVIDIDFFKNINDSYGHSVGDDVLRKISTLLMEQFRTSDYIARVGGDEFAIIMTKLGVNAEEIIQRKVSSMNRILQHNDDGLPPVSLSVGVALSEEGFSNAVVENADRALYNVKNGGRCNCSFFEGKNI